MSFWSFSWPLIDYVYFRCIHSNLPFYGVTVVSAKKYLLINGEYFKILISI